MTRRRWLAAAAITALTAGICIGAAAETHQVLKDPAGYHTVDPALPTPTAGYVRRPLPLPELGETR